MAANDSQRQCRMTTQAHGQATAVYEIQFAYGFGRRTTRAAAYYL